MTKTNAEKQRDLRNRRKLAHDLLKQAALAGGWMQHQRDGAGYDQFVAMLASGEINELTIAGLEYKNPILCNLG